MRLISKLLRWTSDKRGEEAENKAGKLLNFLLGEGKIKELVPVAESSFMNKVLKIDNIIRRLDGKVVPLQVKSSFSPDNSIEFTPGMIKYFDENWSHPIMVVLKPEEGWEKKAKSVWRQINSWKGHFEYQDWQIEYSPFLDWEKFKMLGYGIQLRAEVFLEVRADPAKAQEYEKKNAAFEEIIAEKSRISAQETVIREICAKKTGLKNTSEVRSFWMLDRKQDRLDEEYFRMLADENVILSFSKIEPYSWAALVWQTDFVVRRRDCKFAPISTRKRIGCMTKLVEAQSELFLKKFGALPLVMDADIDIEKINSWAGDFSYSGQWAFEKKSFFSPSEYKRWTVDERITCFLNLSWLKNGIEEDILNAAGIQTYRDKRGILFLK